MILDTNKQDVALEIWDITEAERSVFIPILKSSNARVRSFYAEKLGDVKLVKCFADEEDAKIYCLAKKDSLKLLHTTFAKLEENLTTLFDNDRTKTIMARLYAADSKGTLIEIETIWTSEFN